jgi:hypothetical protein
MLICLCPIRSLEDPVVLVAYRQPQKTLNRKMRRSLPSEHRTERCPPGTSYGASQLAGSMEGRTDTDHVQLDLLLGILDGVRAVADVAADSESKVTADGAYDRRVQLAESGR